MNTIRYTGTGHEQVFVNLSAVQFLTVSGMLSSTCKYGPDGQDLEEGRALSRAVSYDRGHGHIHGPRLSHVVQSQAGRQSQDGPPRGAGLAAARPCQLLPHHVAGDAAAATPAAARWAESGAAAGQGEGAASLAGAQGHGDCLGPCP